MTREHAERMLKAAMLKSVMKDVVRIMKNVSEHWDDSLVVCYPPTVSFDELIEQLSLVEFGVDGIPV